MYAAEGSMMRACLLRAVRGGRRRICSEDNDARDGATLFDGCVEGSVEPGDDDYLSVVAPDGATQMKVSHTEVGRVLYRLKDDPLGLVVNITDAIPIAVKGGETYTFRVSSLRDGEGGVRT